MMRKIVSVPDDNAQLHIEIMSFGFKRGIPRAGDLVFDVRFLPNPFYIKELGHFSRGWTSRWPTFVLQAPRHAGIFSQVQGHAYVPAAPLRHPRASTGW